MLQAGSKNCFESITISDHNTKIKEQRNICYNYHKRHLINLITFFIVKKQTVLIQKP